MHNVCNLGKVRITKFYVNFIVVIRIDVINLLRIEQNLYSFRSERSHSIEFYRARVQITAVLISCYQ